MKLLVISDYNNRGGSGYTSITHGLLAELGRREHHLLLLAFNYDGLEHQLNAGVVPSDPLLIRQQVVAALGGFRPDAALVIMDVPWQHKLRYIQGVVPYLGIFPIESDPLVHPSDFTMTIDTMDAALCETRFGTQLLLDVGIRAQFLPIPVEPFWRPPSPEERLAARVQLGVEERFVVLTVADNHERKNLPVHYATIALLAGQRIDWPPGSGRWRRYRKAVPETFYILNTKQHAPAFGAVASYDNAALTDRFGITDRCLVMNHPDSATGLAREQLRNLYWAADCFLLLSKAEGLGLPVLEAMACAVPVVGGAWTGIAESLGNGLRGQVVPAEYSHIDPFHNQVRRWADPWAATDALVRVHHGGREIHQMVNRGLEHVRSMSWAASASIFEEVLTNVLKSRPQAPAAPIAQERPEATS